MCIQRIRNQFTNFNWKRALLSLGIGIVVVLGGGIPLAISYGIIAFLAYSSIIVAISAIFVSMRSLQLTRNTQRPFLNVSGCTPLWSHNDDNLSTIKYFVVQINNTGVFPANNVSVLFSISDINDSNKKRLLTLRKDIPTICFPNDGISNLIFEELVDGDKLTVQEGGKIKAEIEIRYSNKLTNELHHTIRSYIAKDTSMADEQLTPRREEDDWD